MPLVVENLPAETILAKPPGCYHQFMALSSDLDKFAKFQVKLFRIEFHLNIHHHHHHYYRHDYRHHHRRRHRQMAVGAKKFSNRDR